MRIGITERGDAGINFEWVSKIDDTDYSVIITKNTTTERFHEEAIKHKNKMLLHATITGWGNTPMEPNVPSTNASVASVCKLIEEGFPAEQIVWRIDPIIDATGIYGLKRAHRVFETIHINEHLHNVKRIRTSVMDGYAHAINRMNNIGVKRNYSTFTAPENTFQKINEMLNIWKKAGYTIEACAEPKLNAEHIGCVNNKDAKIFGLEINTKQVNGQNRYGCLCSTAKTELLTKREQCPHQCAYCYWK